MDFNRIYEAGETIPPADTSVNPTDSTVAGTEAGAPQDSAEAYSKAQDEVYIVLNQLKLKIKEFKNNEQIKAMIDRYDSITKENTLTQPDATKPEADAAKPVTESTDTSDKQRLNEAFEKKGTMKYFYRKVCNVVDGYIKWLILGVIVVAALAIVAGVKANNAYQNALKAAGIGKADGPGLLKWVLHKDDAQAAITSTGNEQAVSKIMSDPALSDIEKKEKLQAMSASNPVAASSVAELDKKISTSATTPEVDATGTSTTATGTSTTTETPTQAVDLSTWKARVKAGKASDADMEEAYKAYKAGSYTPGPKTMEYFKQKHPEGFATPTTAPTTPETPTTVDTTGTGTTSTGTSTTPDAPTTDTPTTSDKPWEADAGFQRWKKQNAKNYNSMVAQAQATGRNPDEAAYAMYKQALASNDVNAFRSAQNAQGMTDASGSGRTDRYAMKTMNKANLQAYNAQQVDQMAQTDPNLKQFIDLYKQKNPKMANASNEDIIKKAAWNSGLKKAITNSEGQTEWVVPPENQAMYNALQNANKLLKNKAIPTA